MGKKRTGRPPGFNTQPGVKGFITAPPATPPIPSPASDSTPASSAEPSGARQYYTDTGVALTVVREHQQQEYEKAVEKVREENTDSLLHSEELPYTLTKEIERISHLVQQYPHLCRREDIASLMKHAYTILLRQRYGNSAMESLTLFEMFDNDHALSSAPPTFVMDWLVERYADYGERYSLAPAENIRMLNEHYCLLLRAPTISRDLLETTIRRLLPNEETAESARICNYRYYCWAKGLGNPTCSPQLLSELYWAGSEEVKWACVDNVNAPSDILLDACSAKHPLMRRRALQHPNCPEEGRVAAALMQGNINSTSPDT